MNKRIQELAKQAEKPTSEFISEEGGDWHDVFVEKFAELLVRECIDTTKRIGILEDIENETDMVVNAIKEKFGL